MAWYGGFAAIPNQLLTTELIADRALMRFSELATFLKSINKEYDSSFNDKVAKIGDTLRVPIPQHTNVRHGRVANPTPLQTIVREVKIIDQTGFEVQCSSAELALDIEEFDKRYLSQQVADLVIDVEAAAQRIAHQSTPNQTGDPATAFTELFYGNLSKKIIEDNGGFKGTKKMLLNSSAETTIIPSLSGLFNAQKQIALQYEEGEMGRAAGFDWNSSTVVPDQTRGAGAGYLVNGAGQTGPGLIVDTGTGAIFKGEIITLAGVFAVHPQTKQSLGYLRQFVVTADYPGGSGTIAIYPPIITTGSEKNVTAGPADNAAVTIFGAPNTTYGNSLAYTRDAFTFVTVDLPEYPDRPCTRRMFENVSMRVANGSDMINDLFMFRFDIMWGFGALRPEWAVRVANDPSLLTPPTP